ncbi:YiaA/YiaB family inner membrane protein [Streptomyces sp. ACA25]|uniref:YiaA/YiaB family inner membrane protein n=1 Tax=Streptomyces sp. ACA25 TaxID=3022596 RepID=UPI0023078A8B|nr:YiaA/YiaB family inner membrane protein [Streptomyces sp. ACA25]MDB1087767.1 YiaA/YiaB family inner membrane protein [Streptomyces sp. ACA25]
MTSPLQKPPTTAFVAQAALAFGIALVAMVYGIIMLPLGTWERGYLALGLVFLTSSTFTLAKCVRDRQDITQVTTRVDQARLDKLLSEHDPFEVKM